MFRKLSEVPYGYTYDNTETRIRQIIQRLGKKLGILTMTNYYESYVKQLNGFNDLFLRFLNHSDHL